MVRSWDSLNAPLCFEPPPIASFAGSEDVCAHSSARSGAQHSSSGSNSASFCSAHRSDVRQIWRQQLPVPPHRLRDAARGLRSRSLLTRCRRNCNHSNSCNSSSSSRHRRCTRITRGIGTKRPRRRSNWAICLIRLVSIRQPARRFSAPA